MAVQVHAGPDASPAHMSGISSIRRLLRMRRAGMCTRSPISLRHKTAGDEGGIAMIDEHAGESLLDLAERSIIGERMVAELERFAAARGAPNFCGAISPVSRVRLSCTHCAGARSALSSTTAQQGATPGRSPCWADPADISPVVFHRVPSTRDVQRSRRQHLATRACTFCSENSWPLLRSRQRSGGNVAAVETLPEITSVSTYPMAAVAGGLSEKLELRRQFLSRR